MNNEFLRMKELLEGLGLGFQEGGFTNAEIFAYSKGLEFIRDLISSSLKEIFADESNEGYLSKYADLLKIDKSRYSLSRIKEMIVQRLSNSFGDYTKGAFNSAFSDIGSGSYTIDSSDVTFSNVAFDDLEELGKFINSYILLSKNVSYNGTGLTFDEWESLQKNFYYFNKINLPFSIIDNLRSDIIEQH